MRFLALDLSKRRTGWAYWDGEAQKPLYGHWELGSEHTNDGHVYAKLYERLTEHESVLPVDVCAIEQPIHPAQLQGGTNIDSLRILSGLCAHVHSFGYFKSWKPVREINNSSWRRDFIGPQKRGTKRKALKDLTMERCQQFGWAPRYDDEADALGILDYVIGLPGFKITAPWRMQEALRAPLGVV